MKIIEFMWSESEANILLMLEKDARICLLGIGRIKGQATNSAVGMTTNDHPVWKVSQCLLWGKKSSVTL